MKSRRFIQCDVFSRISTKGNALAVVVDGEGLSDEQMHDFAKWTNLAETTFLLPPSDERADYKVRIFTPTREMPFAGHPTLGSCAAWLHTGGQPKEVGLVRQECVIGLVDIDLSLSEPAFVAPPTAVRPMQAANLAAISEALQLDADSIVRTAELDNGPVWQAIELQSAEQVLAVESAAVRWPDFKAIGLFGSRQAGDECDYEVRMLAPSSGMSEDPITGSLNSALACWLHQQDRLQEQQVMAQGTVIGRHGRVHIGLQQGDEARILIGGHTEILIQGHVVI